MTQSLQMKMPDDVLAALQRDPDDFVTDLRLAAAAKWYEIGLISQEKAAEIADMSRAEFIASLKRFAVSPFQETAGEVHGFVTSE